MTGKWTLDIQRIDGKRQYRAYRLRDKDKPDHSGNREYYGEYTPNYGAALGLVEYLNERDAGQCRKN